MPRSRAMFAARRHVPEIFYTKGPGRKNAQRDGLVDLAARLIGDCVRRWSFDRFARELAAAAAKCATMRLPRPALRPFTFDDLDKGQNGAVGLAIGVLVRPGALENLANL